ncbi:hypothetical protein, partial [Oceanobacter sp. 4_MG-2023]
GSAVLGANNSAVASFSSPGVWGSAFSLQESGFVFRWTDNASSGSVSLWDGSWSDLNEGRSLNEVYLTTMPMGVMTSQGLV